MKNNYQWIQDHFKEIDDLEHALSVLSWDEEVMMPEGGAQSRNSAMATLSSLIHKRLKEEGLSKRLKDIDTEPLDDWQRANIRLIKKKVLEATVVPDDLVHRLTLASRRSTQQWRKLRAENNWRDFEPFLKDVVKLVKEVAEIKGQHLGLDPYDVLLDEYSPGLNQASIDPIFDDLKLFLPVAIKDVVLQQQQRQLKPIAGFYPIEKQKQVATELMKVIGFDFKHGRLDVSHHPFCGGVAEDIRITTRYNTGSFVESVMGVCHETGHALYERGLPREYLTQPVGKALGMTVHESQSLLVEMHACRSREFVRLMSDFLKKQFGELDCLEVDNLYAHYTSVRPGLIRVDADEMTYPLHVILRYEIEKALFAGEIEVSDLPALWSEKMSSYLDIDTMGNYKDGVMQDVHWPMGAFGYFPAYALGSLLASQLYQTALKHNPQIPAHIARGDFAPLMQWLRHHIHSHGSLDQFDDLVRNASGSTLSASAYIEHIKNRYFATELV
ncbi:MAG: carboxypeptidase M32 [Francisellaceae bacterium]